MRRTSPDYTEANRRAAFVILQAPDLYPGLPTLWARLWVSQHGGVAEQHQHAGERGQAGEQMQLGFEQEAA